MPDLSAILLTWNSGRSLRKALESVQSCSDILLLDGGSTDDTLSIAKEFGARVIAQTEDGATGPITDFSAVRNRGIAEAGNDWVLFLDSDEWMSEDAMEDAKRIAHDAQPAAYTVARRYVLSDGSIVTRASTYPNERLYFFHRNAVTGFTRPVHERVTVKPGMPVGTLKGSSLAPLGTVEEYWRKNEKYLTLELQNTDRRWGAWMKRVIRAVRGQIVSTVRLVWIWLIPGGTRMPMSHELARWKYRWKLVWKLRPDGRNDRKSK